MEKSASKLYSSAVKSLKSKVKHSKESMGPEPIGLKRIHGDRPYGKKKKNQKKK